jgi:hypothetical protein
MSGFSFGNTGGTNSNDSTQKPGLFGAPASTGSSAPSLQVAVVYLGALVATPGDPISSEALHRAHLRASLAVVCLAEARLLAARQHRLLVASED